MYKISLICLLLIYSLRVSAQNSSTNSGGQVVTVQPKIMVIPFTKKEEDMRTVLESDPIKRIVITKVKEAFDKRGFTTVDFLTKLKAAIDMNIFTSNNQTDVKQQFVNFSGADIYVEVDVTLIKDGAYNGVNIVVTGNEVSSGNSLSNKTSTSGTFATEDYGLLSVKAIDKIADEFLNVLQTKFTEIIENGKSIVVNISFDKNSAYNLSSEIGSSGLPFSDLMVEWMDKNAYKSNYHLQGTTDLGMLFDDVKIPIKDQATKQNYNSNKFALLIFQYLKSLSLSPAKEIKGNTIFITIK